MKAIQQATIKIPSQIDQQFAMCLSEIVINSLFYMSKTAEKFSAFIDRRYVYLILAFAPEFDHPIGSGAFLATASSNNNPMLSALHAEEQATLRLANLIIKNSGVRSACWYLAEAIATSGLHWSPEDFTYDCMVVVGLKPKHHLCENVYEELACNTKLLEVDHG